MKVSPDEISPTKAVLSSFRTLNKNESGNEETDFKKIELMMSMSSQIASRGQVDQMKGVVHESSKVSSVQFRKCSYCSLLHDNF